MASAQRWTLRFNDGRLPWWIFDPARRVPGTRALDYLALARLLWPPAGKTVGEVVASKGPLYWRLVEPLLLAALNIDPPHGSAKLAAAVIRETLAAGGRACRPLVARDGLSATLVEPALALLQERGATVLLEHQLRTLRFGTRRVDALDFGGETIALAAEDAVILAVPPYAAASLIRGLDVPTEFRAIVNAHFRIEPPAGSAADPRRAQRHGANGFSPFPAACRSPSAPAIAWSIRRGRSLPKAIWAEVASVTGLPAELPPWQIVRERRATFAATPAQDSKRPGAETAWRNLALAGDWTDTGLPATIEGAIRSGNRAAELIASRQVRARHERCVPNERDGSRPPHRSGDRRRCSRRSAPTDIGCSSWRPTPPSRPNMCCCAIISASRSMPGWSKIAVYLRRIQGAHGGWPLFHDGAFDMSATVKAYFALKMIGDDAAGRRTCAAPARRSGCAAAPSGPTCSRAACWRFTASCRGARCR